MSRYIDADATIERLKSWFCVKCDNYNGVRCRACLIDDAICAIEDEPTADVAEVVRCRECRYHEDEEVGMVYCATPVGGWVSDNWFCADGAREEDEQNG